MGWGRTEDEVWRLGSWPGQVEAGNPPKSESLGLEVTLLGMTLPPEAADIVNVCDMFVGTFFFSTNC